MARHRRPVNVRDDGLPAVLGPLVNEGGVERAVLLDVDSGMVLDAWARGEGVAPDAAAGGGATPDACADTVPGGGRAAVDGASFGGGAAAVVGSWFGAGAGLDGGGSTAGGGALFGGGPAAGALFGGGPAADGGALFGVGAVPGGGSLGGGGEAAGGGATLGAGAGPGDVEALGARHADLVRALFALAGTPPAELSLAVDDRHHLVRCVADPAGGRLALAVVVAGSSWVVRRVRRHLRQLPDAGLTTGPWILSWAMGPPPAPKPPVDRPRVSDRDGLSWAERPTGEPAATVIGGWLPSQAAQPQSGGVEGWPAPPPGGADGWPPSARPPHAAAVDDPAVDDWAPSPDEPLSVFADGRPPSPAELQDAGFPSPAPDGPDFEGSPPAPNDDIPTTAVPDPRRGPAPPSALPPARSAGGR